MRILRLRHHAEDSHICASVAVHRARRTHTMRKVEGRKYVHRAASIICIDSNACMPSRLNCTLY